MFINPPAFWLAMTDGPPSPAASACAGSAAGIVLAVLLVLAVAILALESRHDAGARRRLRRLAPNRTPLRRQRGGVTWGAVQRRTVT